MKDLTPDENRRGFPKNAGGISRFLIFFTLVFAPLCVSWFIQISHAKTQAPFDLRCEYAADPQGLDVLRPRLFWKLNGRARAQKQTSFQILAASSVSNLVRNQGDLWDSGLVQSEETTHIRYAGQELKTSQQVFWKVRVWDARGKVSAWSKPATWTMGILDPADWHANWITASDTNFVTLLLRREFQVKPELTRALITVCGLGEFDLSSNGKKVGADLFPPGWTKFDKTSLYATYDVTPQLHRGTNTLGILLGNGMYNVTGGGRFTKFKGSFGPLKAIAQLRLEYADGSVEIIGTDEQWRTRSGPHTFATVYGGEDLDARLVQHGWNEPGFDDSKWHAALIMGDPGTELKGLSCSAPPIRAFENHRPLSMRTLTNGVIVFDLGQNASHMFRLQISGPAGSKVKIMPAEILFEDGSANQRSMGVGRRGFVWCEFTKGTDEIETWSPAFFYVGCHYVQAELTPASAAISLPKIESFEAPVVHSACDPVGEFECSNPLFNRIRKLVRWAQRSNMMSVMTDCPHRERLGWLEEDHLNGPALRYEFNLSQLFTKMMNDIADSQLTSGLVPTTAPEYTIFRTAGDTNHLRNNFGDSPEWSASFILVPWQQYQFDGDVDLLAKHYDGMKRYLDYFGTRATNYIADFGLGDWYDLGPKPPGISQLTPPALTATAFYFHDADIMSKIATLLGRPDDAKNFSDLAQNIRTAFNENFFNVSNHTYATGSQCANAIPLVFGLCEDSNRAAVVDALVADVRANGNTTGDVGYRYLLRALADGGRSDVIFEMNNQTNKPGYGYQLTLGATSLTEAWNARSNSSQNHFMLGQIQEWFYHDLAGIRPDPSGPGFKRIIIAPQVVGDLKWVKASYNSIHGRIISDWKRDGSMFTLRVRIPANTTGTVFVPAKAVEDVRESGRPAEHSDGVKFLRMENDCAVYGIESGEYEFRSKF